MRLRGPMAGDRNRRSVIRRAPLTLRAGQLRMTRQSLLPPPNRNRLLPISIALLSGRNPRMRGFGWGRVGVGGREVAARRCPPARPPPPPPPPQGGGGRKRGAPPAVAPQRR